MTGLKKIFLCCFFYGMLPSSFGQVAYSQQQVNYDISVTLHDTEKTLDGFITIDYTNHSPDTLFYIWFHLWPNAYKNDRTAFSEQLLKLGRTDFYFSNEQKRGYINRLDFKVNGVAAVLEDHPNYIDIAKLVLPAPLAPGKTIRITTPFHEKIPYNFSRGGYVGNTFQMTQWYPKPAVYDRKGWHEMPYLDQGEFYSEFGNFRVQITLPADYVVAATGELQDAAEKQWLQTKGPVKSGTMKEKDGAPHMPLKKTGAKNRSSAKKPPVPAARTGLKTLTYVQERVHDFAWFADKDFIVRQDTLQLPSGRIIDVFSYYTPSGEKVWANSIRFIKDAVSTRSVWLGEYPYNVVSAVEAHTEFSGGMEYPTITCISPMPDERSLERTIEHEVGHNWLYGIIASNERQHPWMDEGMNTYFDNRYEEQTYGVKKENEKGFFKKRLPEDYADIVYRTQAANRNDQPVETSSEDLSAVNYGTAAYYKAGLWMKKLEEYLGRDLFDSCLREYYCRWEFKHPYPEDFKRTVDEVSGKNTGDLFSLLYKKGTLDTPSGKKFRLSLFFNFNHTDQYRYLFLSPAVGYNLYDGIMPGIALHNYTLPVPAFHFFAIPLYGVRSNSFNFIGRAGFGIMSNGAIRKTEISLAGEKFTTDEYTDPAGTAHFTGFYKIVPSVKLIFRNRYATIDTKKWVQWKTFLIRESSLAFTTDTLTGEDVITRPVTGRYLNQLSAAIENPRALYPYTVSGIVEQSRDFVRLAFEGIYYFNYATKGGLEARLFAGKFIYLGDQSLKQFQTGRYHLNMTGANGYEDYMYSNYFAGRNEYDGFLSQQIMIRDGGFKVRTDLYQDKIGKSDNWLAALNLKSDVPDKLNPLQVLPFRIPLKLFLDIGTYAEAWQKNASTGRFIYDGGFQLSIGKDLINVYFPLVYSKVYSSYLKSVYPRKQIFAKNISFSIDIQRFRLHRFFNIPDL